MSGILSIYIHDGGDLSEKEMIVLPKGATMYVPNPTAIHTTGPVREVNVSIGGLSDETVRRVAELIRKGEQAPPASEEIHLG